ncbi:MAG: hypothetical protein K9W45_09465 [Candidatus Heimdallarchaeum aukensis]|uniref:Nmd3 N-terminal domain-containing protein n=1 Tax=Candidatus Heimdallarchaeum aukensis TaxID=2876573 RepID=A0A9Y1FKZ4_9ARCH|nr:MAG: hypothetical protein K9W45_09465 [Candidatus Heimdallarchaeum aukensis]
MTKGRFCAICGTTEGPFVKNLCEECYFKEYTINIKLPKQLTFNVCPYCGTISIAGMSVNPFSVEQDFDIVLRELARSKITENVKSDIPFRYEFKEDDISLEKINQGYKNFKISIIFYFKPEIQFREIEKEFEIEIKIRKATCEQCIRYKTGYHEAVLQVRGTNRKLRESEEKEVEDLLQQELENSSSNSNYLTDIQIDKDGITANVSTKLFAEELAKKIKEKMAARYSVAYTLVTQTRDKQDVYRNTYLVKLPEFIKGDIVNFEGKIWLVTNTKAEEVTLLSLEDHRERKINRKKFEKTAKKRNDEVFEREYMYLSDEGDSIRIMTMDTYENFEEPRGKIPKETQVGETLKGFILDEKNYYYPKKMKNNKKF